MSQNVMVTGAGKVVGLGFNLVLRYLEAGDNVVATIRKPCAELDELKSQYGDKLTILTMDISNSESVNIFCVHPGWIRTDGRPDNPAPLSSYEAAEILRVLFEKKREDFECHRFITNLDEDYPF